MDILLSVIIPVFNGEPYIQRLYTSIIKQNQDILHKLEIIFVDDGSNDNSFLLCSSISDKNKRVKVISKSNGGIASARNVGLSHALGKYVAFCDQDDTLVNGYQYFINTCENSQVDMIITSPVIDQEKKPIASQFIKNEKLIDRHDIEKLLLYFIGEKILVTDKELHEDELPNIPPSIWNCIFRRDVIIKHGINFKRFVDFEDDWLFIISMLYYSTRIAVTPLQFYAWTIHSDSESHKKKYIADFSEKRILLYDWINVILNNLSIPIDRKEMFQKKIHQQTLLWGFYNACNLNYAEYKKEIIILRDTYIEDLQKNIYPLSRLGSIYINLIKAECYFIPYLVNKYILKKSYH